MGVVRRFLNLIVDNHVRGTKSLRCIDMNRQKLFNTAAPAQQMNGSGSESEEGPQDASFWAPESFAGTGKKKPVALKLGRISLPRPSIKFEPTGSILSWCMNFFPLAGRKVLCADQSGRTLLFDADTHYVAAMPALNEPKSFPFSIFVPSADPDDNDNGGGSLFVMERYPVPETGSVQQSHQFEAFVYGKPTSTSFSKSWNCQLLPPPPFVCDPKYRHDPCRKIPQIISSYGVIDGGSSVCISVDGVGTYCLDTMNHTWSSAGDWTLPFRGKFEYVPELQLWFGLSAYDSSLVAVDLSAMDSPPRIVESWKELEPPEEWMEMLEPQLNCMGSGRFCITRFFQTLIPMGIFGEQLVERRFSVITGVDVVRCVHNGNGSINRGDGKPKLGIVTHRSKRHMSDSGNGNIVAVF